VKIAVVTPWFPNVRDGWPARYVSDSAISLSKAGARLSVSVVRGWIPSALQPFAPLEHRGETARDQFPEIDRISTKRYLWAPGDRVRRLTNVTLDQAVVSALDEAIEAEGADLIHAHTEGFAPAALKVAQRRGLPLVVTLHGENTNRAYTSAPSQADRFRNALSGADRIVIVGEPLRAFAERLAGRNDHIVTVWNGVDGPADRRRAPTPDILPVELICTANLQEGKGVDLLLDALGRLRMPVDEGLADWRLTIVGDGPMRDELRGQVESLGMSSRITFAGVMSNAEVFKRLSLADVFILPSYREAFGVAYVEAMATGLLTIGVEGQGPSQFIAHGRTGLLMKPRDVDSIEATLREVLGDKDRRWRGIAEAGADFVRQFCTWRAHAEKLLEVFEGICKQNLSLRSQQRPLLVASNPVRNDLY
jgi:glycosyltransferase involved in cell wall biosynthesis